MLSTPSLSPDMSPTLSPPSSVEDIFTLNSPSSPSASSLSSAALQAQKAVKKKHVLPTAERTFPLTALAMCQDEGENGAPSCNAAELAPESLEKKYLQYLSSPRVVPVEFKEAQSKEAQSKEAQSTDTNSHPKGAISTTAPTTPATISSSHPSPPRATRLQQAGIEFILRKRGRCLIADEMGVGKTLQALLAMWYYRQEFPLLVVCPSTLRGVWKSEAEKWLEGYFPNSFNAERHVQIIKTGKDAYEPGKLIYIISYSLLAPASNSDRDFSQLPVDTCRKNAMRGGELGGVGKGKGGKIGKGGKMIGIKGKMNGKIGVNGKDGKKSMVLKGKGTKQTPTSTSAFAHLFDETRFKNSRSSPLNSPTLTSAEIDESRFQCIILDESHYIKNADSNRTRAVLDVCRFAKRCLLLSGTPTPNQPLELLPQFQALYPDMDLREQVYAMDTITDDWGCPGPVYVSDEDYEQYQKQEQNMNNKKNFRNNSRNNSRRNKPLQPYTLENYFKHRYCVIEERQVAVNPWSGSPIYKQIVIEGKRLEELHRFLKSEIMIRRTKEEALPELPGLNRVKVVLEGIKGLKKEARVSEELRRKMEGKIEGEQGEDWKNDGKNGGMRNGDTNSNSSCTNGGIIGTGGGSSAGFTREELSQLKLNFKETGLAKAKGASDYICEFLSETTGFKEKIVIFGHHTEVLTIVENNVRKLLDSHNKKKDTVVKLDMACHYGAHCDASKIDEKVAEFQKDDLDRVDSLAGGSGNTSNSTSMTGFSDEQSSPRRSLSILILGITAGNVGLTLTRSSTVIFTELFWVPASILQAEARVHRKGQKRLSQIYYLMHPGKESLDGVVFTTLNKKYGSAKVLMDGVSVGGVSAVGGGVSVASGSGLSGGVVGSGSVVAAGGVVGSSPLVSSGRGGDCDGSVVGTTSLIVGTTSLMKDEKAGEKYPSLEVSGYKRFQVKDEEEAGEEDIGEDEDGEEQEKGEEEMGQENLNVGEDGGKNSAKNSGKNRVRAGVNRRKRLKK